jgi:hypothetical protein
MIEKEIWKDIKGYEGLYQVSNLGNIKSLSREIICGNGRTLSKEKIFKFRNCDGYNRVHLMKYKKEKNLYVHRLVAEMFIPNPNNLPIINHIDENRSNNHVDNLEWCTQKENVNHGTAIERMSKTRTGHEVKKETRNKISKALMGIKRENIQGGKHYLSRSVICTTTNEKFKCIEDAKRKYKANNISACCRGIYKTSGALKNGTKLKWQYI